MPRHIPSIVIVLKGDGPPCAATEPIRKKDFKALAAVNIPTVLCQTVTLRLIADL